MRNILFLSLLIVSYTSCKKDKTVIECVKDYSQLEVGNYWIYNIYYVNDRGEKGLINVDSVVISQDTMIDNKKFYLLEGVGYTGSTRKTLEILRDSLNYLVNPAGEILFSTVDFDRVLREKIFVPNPNDTISTSFYTMRRVVNTIQTAAGTYADVLNYQEALYSKLIISGRPSPLLQNSYYAKGVGIIFEDKGHLSSNARWEKELVRYRVN